jgi:L-fuculose-phosphate aldolase
VRFQSESQPQPGSGRTGPDKVLHVTALVKRTAHIVWGARALGSPVPNPDEVNTNFAGVYTYLRANPM